MEQRQSACRGGQPSGYMRVCRCAGGHAGVPVTGRGALRPNRSLRAERAVSLACAALANRQIGFGRVRIALRPFPHRCVGFGGELRRTWHGRVRAFRWRPRLPPRSASGLGRPPHPPDAGHPALAEYRLRGLASPRRRGGASGRPRCARPRVRPRPAAPRWRHHLRSSLRRKLSACAYPAAAFRRLAARRLRREPNWWGEPSRRAATAHPEGLPHLPSPKLLRTNTLRLELRGAVEWPGGPYARTG